MVPVIPDPQLSSGIGVVRIFHREKARIHVAVFEVELPLEKGVCHEFVLVFVFDREAVSLVRISVCPHDIGGGGFPFLLSRRYCR